MDILSRNISTDESRRGSLIVDAACFMPIFLIAMIMLIFIATQAGVEDTVVAAGRRGASASALVDSVLEENSSASSAVSFAAGFYLSLGDEWEEGPTVLLTGFQSERSERLSPGLYIDGICEAKLHVLRRAGFGGLFSRLINSRRRIVFRPWRGESARLCACDSDRVYVFPKSGERYHVDGCRILREGSVQLVLNAELRKKFSGCKLCDAAILPDGAFVYMFSQSSKTFHKKNCSCITKYFVSMPKSEAIESGYTPCMICSGGD